jgi:hypothetical protein
MFGYFYNQNLRKLVVGFGTLFSNVQVQHSNPDESTEGNFTIRVPITYAPQEKFIRRLLEPSSISSGTRIENQLPRMSYIITNILPDPSRRRNKLNPVSSAIVANNQCTSVGEQIFEQVPVNVSFSLFIYTRHIDDTLQIFEQIIPYFNPDHFIKLSMNSVQESVDIPITMVSNNMTERYDGDFGNRRINISSINFLAKSFIYGKVESYTSIQEPGVINILEDI